MSLNLPETPEIFKRAEEAFGNFRNLQKCCRSLSETSATFKNVAGTFRNSRDLPAGCLNFSETPEIGQTGFLNCQ